MNLPNERNAAPPLDEILEALLLAAGEPMTLERIEGVFESDRPSRAAIRESLAKLGERLASAGALELAESASGYRLRIRRRCSAWVSRLWDERPQRYSRALLETLSLIAYRQPVTRGDIEEVRGVAVSSSILRTLVERGWIRVVGHRDVPGRPAVYATTRGFLDDLGLESLESLPPMYELQHVETFETAIFEPVDDASGTADALGGTAGEQDSAGGGQDGSAIATDAATPALEESALPQQLSAAPASTGAETHAGKAPPGQSPSFAELEARLAERTRQRCEAEEDSDVEAGAQTREKDDGAES